MFQELIDKVGWGSSVCVCVCVVYMHACGVSVCMHVVYVCMHAYMQVLSSLTLSCWQYGGTVRLLNGLAVASMHMVRGRVRGVSE